MKKDLREWIDREVERLDREVEGEEPKKAIPDPVPEELQQALGETGGTNPKKQ